MEEVKGEEEEMRDLETPEVRPVKGISLPLSKIKMIMKSSPEVTSISQESVNLIARATEMFVQHLAVLALRNSNGGSAVDYKDLAEVVNRRDTMEFLHDIIPRKIKAKDYILMLEEETDTDNEDDLLDGDDDDDDDDDDSSEEESDDE